jgi:integrase
MYTENYPTILFWLRKNCSSNPKIPIYARITIHGKRSEVVTKCLTNSFDWDAKSQKVMSKSVDATATNNRLTKIKAKLLSCYEKLADAKDVVTAQDVKKKYLGIANSPRMLIEIIKQHNSSLRKLIGKGSNKTICRRYELMQEQVAGFIKWKFKLSDIPLQHLNVEFIFDLEFYLKSEKNIDSSTNPCCIKKLKHIAKACVVKKWLTSDPFVGFKMSPAKSTRGYLTTEEVNVICDKKLPLPRLEFVKDMFLFSCFTGLAYIDIYNLTAEDIVVGIDKKKWISTERQKTETSSKIPLLPQAMAILKKYSSVAKNENRLFPMLSNQKTNLYLKEISVLCGLTKPLTFHMARHTFATIITLTNGVPIETVSKMLGHTKIETTQIYAKVLDNKVSADMKVLNKKLVQKPLKSA